MEEKSWRRNHGGEMLRRNHGGVEEKSWRRNHGGEIAKEKSWRNHGRHLEAEAPGGIQDASRRHPEGTQEVPSRHPGVTNEVLRRPQKHPKGTRDNEEAARGDEPLCSKASARLYIPK